MDLSSVFSIAAARQLDPGRVLGSHFTIVHAPGCGGKNPSYLHRSLTSQAPVGIDMGAALKL